MLCEILEEIGLIVLELKFLQSFELREEEANRVYIWRSIVFENSSNFEQRLFSGLSIEIDEIDVTSYIPDLSLR